MKINVLWNKIISLTIVLVLVFGILPFYTTRSEASDASILQNGSAVSELVLLTNQKTTVSVGDENADAYQWQIFMPETACWIDIYDKTQPTCEISDTLIRKFLSADGFATLRCQLTKGEEIRYSLSVRVRLEEEASLAEDANKQSVPTGLRALERDVAPIAEDYLTYTITIKYLYHNEAPNMNGSVANDYIATIAAGTDFDADVSSPVRTGYKAYLAAESDWNATENRWFVGVDESTLTSGDAISLDVTGISGNQIYYIVYLPQPAEYHISTYFQNKYDDFYSFGASLTKSALVGTVLSNSTNLNLEYEGFVILEYNDTTVAADGSTVLEIYYDRKYHLVNFHLDGGYGVEPIYARYGTDIKVAAPSRAGYVFDGWELVEDGNTLTAAQRATAEQIGESLKNGNSASIPDFDITFKAKWIRSNATYNVIYWQENANNDDYSYWGTVTMNAMSGDVVTFDQNAPEFNINNLDFSTNPVQDGATYNPSGDFNNLSGVTYQEIPIRYEHEYFEFNEEKSEIRATVMGDNSTVINVYYKRRTYNPKFYYARRQVIECHSEVVQPDSNNSLPNGKYIVWYAVSTNYNNCVLTNNRNTSNMLILRGNPQAENAYTLNFERVSNNSYYITDERGYYLEIGASSSNFVNTPKIVTVEWIQARNAWFFSQNGQYLNQHGGRWQTQAGGYNVRDDVGNELVLSRQTTSYSVESGQYQVSTSTLNVSPQTMTWSNANSYLPQINDPRYHYGSDYIGGYNYYYISIPDVKYNQIITDIWPKGTIIPSIGNYSTPEWAPVDGCKYRTENGVNATLKVYTTLASEIINDPKEPDETAFVAWWTTETLQPQTFYIYYSAIPGEDTNIIEYDGMEYAQQDPIVYRMAYNSNTQITPYDYYGVTLRHSFIHQGRPGSSTSLTNNSTFYYERNPHTVSFYNLDRNIKVSNLVYEQKISAAEPITAEVMNRDYYPSTYEKGAYSFKGWSYSPSAYVPVDWENARMDDADFSVYAYWEKTTHRVTFYETYNDLKKLQPLPDGENGDNAVDVPHGNPVSYASTIHRDGYSFVGWFYMNEETNEKIAFLPNNMPVNRDLDIYAEWVADKMIRYTIHYKGVIPQKDGNEEYILENGRYVLDLTTAFQIADDTTGQLQDGRTKTFSAKALPELWDGYNTGYFPELASHAIMFSEDTAETDPTVTVTKVNMDGTPYTGGDEYTYTIDYTFYYVHLDKIRYTVNYINTATGNNWFKEIESGTETLAVESVTKETPEAVTTERFQLINLYVPDEYQKRIVLTAYPDANIINFYYTENQSPMFLVEHLTENLDGTWTVQVREFSTGNVGDVITRHPFDYSGHAFAPDATWMNTQGQTLVPLDGDNWVTEYASDGTASGTLQSGQILVLRFYYTLTTHNYRVEHKILGTNDWLFGTESASTQTGSGKYGERFVGNAMEKNGYYVDGSKTDPTRLSQSKIITDGSNVITFYYVSEPIEINYRIVVAGAVGTNINGCFVTPTLNSTNSHASSVSGSVPHIADAYCFDGWYTDAACTNPVPEEWVGADHKLAPKAVDGIIAQATYYAKAEPRRLTITKKGDVQPNETFLFSVTNGENVNMVVSVTGNTSSTIECIPTGTYTITEIGDWSWKYDCPEAKALTIAADDSHLTVEFTNTRNKNKLLGDETSINNKFSAIK